MALRLDGLSVTNPKGLKSGELESSSLALSFWLALALVMSTVGLLRLLLLVRSVKNIWELGFGEMGRIEIGEWVGELRGGESRGQAPAMVSLVVAV